MRIDPTTSSGGIFPATEKTSCRNLLPLKLPICPYCQMLKAELGDVRKRGARLYDSLEASELALVVAIHELEDSVRSQASKPHFENGTTYHPRSPTKLDKTKNFRLEVQARAVGRGVAPMPYAIAHPLATPQLGRTSAPTQRRGRVSGCRCAPHCTGTHHRHRIHAHPLSPACRKG